MGTKMEFLSPVGRIVQGNPLEKQTTDQQGNPLVIKSGPNAGQPTQRYFVALAYRKDDPLFGPFYQKMFETGRGSFPQLFNAAGQCAHPKFSWKLMDGEGVDDNGKSNATKEGFAGHWVVKFSSSFPPRCHYAGRYQPHEAIQDSKAIPRGYYARISGTMEGNDNTQKPGIYVNLGMLELVGGSPSDIIQSGPDAGAVFGGQAATLPQGVAAVVPGMPAAMPAASALPGMPAAMPAASALPGMPAAMPGAMPGAIPFPNGAPAAAMPSIPASMPGAAVMPGAGPAMTSPSSAPALPIVPQVGFAAGPAALAMPAAPAAGPIMTAKAGGATYEQFVAQGWTLDAMRAQGYAQ